jgi:hypothetical protein
LLSVSFPNRRCAVDVRLRPGHGRRATQPKGSNPVLRNFWFDIFCVGLMFCCSVGRIGLALLFLSWLSRRAHRSCCQTPSDHLFLFLIAQDPKEYIPFLNQLQALVCHFCRLPRALTLSEIALSAPIACSCLRRCRDLVSTNRCSSICACVSVSRQGSTPYFQRYTIDLHLKLHASAVVNLSKELHRPELAPAVSEPAFPAPLSYACFHSHWLACH